MIGRYYNGLVGKNHGFNGYLMMSCWKFTSVIFALLSRRSATCCEDNEYAALPALPNKWL